MNKQTIEKKAKLAVEDFFLKKGYIRTFINENDKTPIWDGNFFVYNTKETEKNSAFLYKIPIQLKGKYSRIITNEQYSSFRLDKDSITQYLQDEGVLFIKVCLNESDERIYFNFLTKNKLKKLLSKIKKSSTSFQLESLNENIELFLEEANAFHLQSINTPITFIDLKEISFNITCHAKRFEGENDIDYIIRNQTQLTVSIGDSDTEYYLDCEDSPLYSQRHENKPILVNGIKYYDSITRICNKQGENTIHIGNSVTLKLLNKGVNIGVSIMLKATDFYEQLKELRFLNALVKYKSLTIGNATIERLPINENDDACLYWSKMLKFWEDTEMLFSILHIYESLDIQNLTTNDYNNLNKLIKAILYNEPLISSQNSNYLELTKIGNLNIILYVKFHSNRKCRLESIQDELIAASESEDGYLYPLPVYSKIFREEALQSNIDFRDIIQKYEAFLDKNPYLYEEVNVDILCLLKHYDKKRNAIILDNIIKLSEWLLNNSPNNQDDYRLNLLQAKYRRIYDFTKEEIEFLYSITDSSNNNYAIKWAAAILLKEYNRAEKYWSNMDDNNKEIHQQFPIYNLIPKDKICRF